MCCACNIRSGKAVKYNSKNDAQQFQNVANWEWVDELDRLDHATI